MAWLSMLYPPDFFKNYNQLDCNYLIKLLFHNPPPANMDNLNKIFRSDFNKPDFNGGNYIYLIDLINNYFSQNIIIRGYNGKYLMIIASLFQSVNTLKKQYFVFPSGYEAELFYIKLRLLVKKLKLNINVMISHSGIKNIKLIDKLKKSDIIIYSCGRFLNNVDHKNIDILNNTIYFCDVDDYNLKIKEDITNYIRNINSPNYTIINYNSIYNPNQHLLGNYKYFNF